MDSNTHKKVEEKENKEIVNKFLVTIQKFTSVKLVLIFLAFLIIGILLIYLSFSKKDELVWYLTLRIGTALITTGFISTIVKKIIEKQQSFIDSEMTALQKREEDKYKNEVRELFKTLNSNIDNISKSYNSLDSLDIEKVYSSRNEAAEDIERSLKEAKFIKIMGISLNDYVRDENSKLYETWLKIKEILCSDGKEINVEVMMIDKNSNGAHIRGISEGFEDNKTRIISDTTESMEHFYTLQQDCDKNQKAKFEARVYRVCPISHLVITDNVIYLESYHFRPRHKERANLVLKIRFDEKKNSLYKELEYHFDRIWSSEILSESLINNYIHHYHGNEKALREASIANSFFDPAVSRNRIISIIEEADKYLLIKGISLHSFFSYGSDIYKALIRKIIQKQGEEFIVRILIINPDSHEAKLRSFRELLITDSSARLENFNDELRQKARLYSDTCNTISFIEKNLLFKDDLKHLTENIKLYNSSIDCFMLISEESALIEQYHYGNEIQDEKKKYEGLILGGDVPLFEYRNNSVENSPYNLFLDSFEFVFDYSSLALSQYNKKNAVLEVR